MNQLGSLQCSASQRYQTDKTIYIYIVADVHIEDLVRILILLRCWRYGIEQTISQRTTMHWCY